MYALLQLDKITPIMDKIKKNALLSIGDRRALDILYPYWIYEVIGISDKDIILDRITGFQDYSKSNGNGKGITINYVLKYFNFYKISSPQTRSKADCYFAYYDNGGENRVTVEHIIAQFI